MIIGVAVAIIMTKLFEKKNQKSMEPVSQSEVSETSKKIKLKKIIGWMLLYLIIISLTGALQGVLGGLALSFGEDYYLIAKFAGALIVYIGIVLFLTRKHTFIAAFEILTIFYLIAVLSRIAYLFISKTDTQLMNIYSISSYILLFAISFTIFFVNKKKVRNGSGG